MQDELEIYAVEKATTIILKSGIQYLRIDGNERFCHFVFPDMPEVRDALQAYFDDTPLPCKSFADLNKSLRQQLYAVKKQRAKAGDLHE